MASKVFWRKQIEVVLSQKTVKKSDDVELLQRVVDETKDDREAKVLLGDADFRKMKSVVKKSVK